MAEPERELTRARCPLCAFLDGFFLNAATFVAAADRVGGRVRPYAGLTGYCVSKAAIDMLTQTIALELAPQGVRVNASTPAW